MLRDALRDCRTRLRDGGIENAEEEARLLMEHVTGYDRVRLMNHADESLSSEQTALLNSLIEKRLTRYPLQYLLGSWSFMGFELSVGEGLLIPRDDTEVAVGLCLDYLKEHKNAKAIDLCAGSGAISIALEQLGKADVTAIELSEQAFKFLIKNIKANHSLVHAVQADVLTCHRDFEPQGYDLIVSNPPYIKRGELTELQPEVQFEPAMALDGGDDGYDFYRAIIRDWSGKLKHGGALVFELGEGQADTVAALMKAQDFNEIRTEYDLGGCQRAIIGTML